MNRRQSLRALVALVLACFCCYGPVVEAKTHDRELAQGDIVTTAACTNIRIEKYPARLDLYYFYTVEYTSESNGAAVDLTGIESAIAHSVASALSECSEHGWPLFAVEIPSVGHAIAGSGTLTTCHSEHSSLCSTHCLTNTQTNSALKAGYCDESSLDGIQCRLVRGVTSILLDSGAGDAESVAYNTIERVLDDTLFLNQFTIPDLLSAEFVRPIQENLILLIADTQDNTSSNSAAKIAIATAAVSCLLTCVFLYGMHRARKRSRDRTQTPVKARVAHLQAKRRHYFQELEQDEQLAPGWMLADPLQLPAPSITWSVSDLTSDGSESILSSMSRLERIDEEAPPGEHQEDNIPDQECATNMPSFDFAEEHLDFIANWNHNQSSDIHVMNDITNTEAVVDVAVVVDPEATTPVHQNRVEGGTPEQSTLDGCHFLEEDSDDEDVDDALNDTGVTSATSDYLNRYLEKDMSDFLKTIDPGESDNVPADEEAATEELAELQIWYQRVMLDLYRAQTQPRLTM